MNNINYNMTMESLRERCDKFGLDIVDDILYTMAQLNEDIWATRAIQKLIPGTIYYLLHEEGTNPYRTKKQLRQKLFEEFSVSSQSTLYKIRVEIENNECTWDKSTEGLDKKNRCQWKRMILPVLVDGTGGDWEDFQRRLMMDIGEDMAYQSDLSYS